MQNQAVMEEKRVIQKPNPAFPDEKIKRDSVYVIQIMEGEEKGQLRTARWQYFSFIDDYDREYLLGQVEVVRET